MKALVFDEDLEFTSNYPIPKRTNDESLIKVVMAGICNTDREIMKGYKNFHGILGHEYVGIVEDSDDKDLIGKRVVGEINIGCGNCEFCRHFTPKHCYNRRCLGISGKDGCFAEYITMPTSTLYVIPDDISNEEALFTEPLAAAASAVDDADFWYDDDQILILGDGRLAYLIYLSLKYNYDGNVKKYKEHMKTHVTVKGHSEKKLSMFEYANTTMDIKYFNKYFQTVFEATGSESGIDEAIKVTKPQGNIIVKTTHEGKTTLDLNTIVVNELSLKGSRCGNFQDALSILKTHPKLPKTKFFKLEDYKEAFESKEFKVGFIP